MDFLLKLSLALALFVLLWLNQEQHQEWVIQRNLLKNANNAAAHDAVQQVQPGALADGQLLIDEATAYPAFVETLRANLGLDASLQPLPGGRLTQEVDIIWFEIVDERTVTFPYLYENPQYAIAKYLRGPAIIAVIETPHPALVGGGARQLPIRVPAIQEYAFAS